MPYLFAPARPCLYWPCGLIKSLHLDPNVSRLVILVTVKVSSSIPSFIPIKEYFIYLGITIYKNIHKIARDNFNNILVKVKNDIQRWKNLPKQHTYVGPTSTRCTKFHRHDVAQGAFANRQYVAVTSASDRKCPPADVGTMQL